jgi:hypothetical protein
LILESSENRTDLIPEGNRQIQLVLNQPAEDVDTIDLGNVFHNMKQKSRIFIWVLVLCLVAGGCFGLLWYQLGEKPLTVSSVVTLRYEAPVEADAWAIRAGRKTLDMATLAPVTDLTAPDGMELDVNQVTSSYVLQTALDGLGLPSAVTAENVRSNIRINRILTEESRRMQESLAGLSGLNNADAYRQLQTTEIKYQNRFVVTLTNGFGAEDSAVKVQLKGAELKLLLNEILTVYNDYLVRTYADVTLPNDAFSVIDTEETDILESLDEVRDGINELIAYINGRTATERAYRSWQTGMTLNDWRGTLQTFRSINADYLYALVKENGIARDRTALLTGWKYRLRLAQNELDSVNESIAETKRILDTYKNDEVYISMQESDAVKSTHASTEYFNSLVLQQSSRYDRVAALTRAILNMRTGFPGWKPRRARA